MVLEHRSHATNQCRRHERLVSLEIHDDGLRRYVELRDRFTDAIRPLSMRVRCHADARPEALRRRAYPLVIGRDRNRLRTARTRPLVDTFEQRFARDIGEHLAGQPG